MDFIQIILAASAAAFSAVLLPLIRRIVTGKQMEAAEKWVSTAVKAAEQLIRGEGKGEERLRYVLGFLKDNGVKSDESELRALIEAAVYELNDRGGEK